MESLPLGNGRLGAMPDGGVTNENIVLNDITLWSGAPEDPNKENAFQYLPQIRKLLFEGKNAAAEKLVNEKFLCKGTGTGRGSGANVSYGSYQVLGNLHLKYHYGKENGLVHATRYVRELSLDSALTRCTYVINGVTYHREYFASFTDDVIIIRLSADKPGQINFTLSLNRPERYRTAVHGRELDMTGQLNNGTGGRGMKYMVRVGIKQDGGQFTPGDSTLQVKHARSAVIYISAGTDFRKAPFREKTLSLLKASMRRPYKDEVSSHVRAYRKLFGRAALFLDNPDPGQAVLPTDERLAAYARNPDDNGLPVLYFQYGRYLLISSTRPGLLPPNLQGLWANSVQTPWNGDYHLDINIEMNHWPLEVTNLPMLNEPFYTLVKGMVAPGEKTAKAYYDSPGWVAYVTTNVWGYTGPGESASWGASVSGSGWLCHVLWNHYAFTLDTAYLRKIYPVIRGAAVFYLHAMVIDPENGWLVTAPSGSPENGFHMADGEIAHVCAGPTIDNQIIRELLAEVTEASRILRKDSRLREQLESAAKKLPPNQIDDQGRLMEWLKPYKGMDPHHRHMSPLWGLFPGNEITLSGTPATARAARALLVQRGDVSTGWSLAWKISLWARLHDGNHCLKLLNDLLKPTTATGYSGPGGTYRNLLDACPPFQIDGNFGGTAGIAGMLLQSDAGYIDLLPALPDAWASGRFTGLCARGGGVVGAKWKDHHLLSVEIRARVAHEFKVKVPPYVQAVEAGTGAARHAMRLHNRFVTLQLPKDGKVHLFFR